MRLVGMRLYLIMAHREDIPLFYPYFLLLPLSFSSRLQRFSCPSISLDGDRRALPASSRTYALISTRDATGRNVEAMDKSIVLAASSSADICNDAERERERKSQIVRFVLSCRLNSMVGYCCYSTRPSSSSRTAVFIGKKNCVFYFDEHLSKIAQRETN